MRFQEVDAAAIVFFGHFFGFAHEAMEDFFAPLDGGYVALINRRRVGLPAVHVEANYRSPLRFGDLVAIDTQVGRIGTRSFVLRYHFRRGLGGPTAAELTHTVVTTNLDTLASCDMPDDVRALLGAHLAP